jgi:NTE family protein
MNFVAPAATIAAPHAKAAAPHAEAAALAAELRALGQIVLVLQGGGALGAYQAGVFAALDEAGVAPDWVVGTSIGAFNAAIIAGNPAGQRLDALNRFWGRLEHPFGFDGLLPPMLGGMMRSWATISAGLPAFFRPNPAAFLGPLMPLGSAHAAYYSVEPMRRLLAECVDFDLVNRGPVRLTVGAANVRNGAMRYFDSRDMALGPEHVLASGALPPAFPAVEIDGEHYWDGGIVSNTPVEVVFDDNPRRSGVVFAVHLWNPDGDAPTTIWEVENRRKDIQYASRAHAHIKRQRQLHHMRHVIAELAAKVPAEARGNAFAELAAWGCTTNMHVVRLLAPSLPGEDHSKDIDFSPEGVRARRAAGLAHTRDTLRLRPWAGDVDPLEGFHLHEVCAGEMTRTPAAEM